MTQRERQLLEWIRENPMISQQELADKAGITRSSVAVHISNLIKKGCITGKGYIVRTDPYVAVVGGVNMDIGAVSAEALVARDSNPGHVTTSLGGVGRNIAHNLCLLGQQTAMVTVMGRLRPTGPGKRQGHRPGPERQRRAAGLPHRHLSVYLRPRRGHGTGRQRHGHL